MGFSLDLIVFIHSSVSLFYFRREHGVCCYFDDASLHQTNAENLSNLKWMGLVGKCGAAGDYILRTFSFGSRPIYVFTSLLSVNCI